MINIILFSTLQHVLYESSKYKKFIENHQTAFKFQLYFDVHSMMFHDEKGKAVYKYVPIALIKE